MPLTLPRLRLFSHTKCNDGMKEVWGIYRATEFSPNSVEKDKAIMDAVAQRLQQRGCHVVLLTEGDLTARLTAAAVWPQLVVSMGRRQHTLQLLEQLHAQGVAVVNVPQAVAACSRSGLDRLMRRHHLPAAPMHGDHGYWVKRGDEAAQCKADVVYAANDDALERCKADFARRGVADVVVTAHVVGDLVKFYGVRGTGFFKIFYPGDDGESKFGDEQINGQAHHYPFAVEDMARDAETLAALTGLDIYGGDSIVRADGSHCIIDFNDWPSFSRCREDAADAIARCVLAGLQPSDKS